MSCFCWRCSCLFFQEGLQIQTLFWMSMNIFNCMSLQTSFLNSLFVTNRREPGRGTQILGTSSRPYVAAVSLCHWLRAWRVGGRGLGTFGWELGISPSPFLVASRIESPAMQALTLRFGSKGLRSWWLCTTRVSPRSS